MRRVLAVIALVVLMAAPGYALSDTEYLRMRRNNVDFANADKRLNQTWSQLKKSLSKSVFEELDELQREWIRSGRDDDAQVFIDDGYSKVEAYTMATHDRADALPQLARDLRRNATPTRRKATTPKPEPRSTARPEQRRKPTLEPEPEPEVVPEDSTDKPEDDGLEPQPLSDPAGEYESDNCFMTVKIADYSSMEAEVTIARWKDEVNWKATGWIDNGVLELSDSRYSTCQVTIVFTSGGAKVSVTDSEDWAKATADDFVIAGVYRKKQ